MYNIKRSYSIHRKPNWTSHTEEDEPGPVIVGNTIPASEDENVAEDVVEDSDEDKEMKDVPQILWDVITSLADLNKEMRSLLTPTPGDTSSHQLAVVPMLRFGTQGRLGNRNTDCILTLIEKRGWLAILIMQERINQQTWNNMDLELIDGLKAISVMHFRIGRLTEKVLNGQACHQIISI